VQQSGSRTFKLTCQPVQDSISRRSAPFPRFAQMRISTRTHVRRAPRSAA
jgi:hypothetical protein